ncbi:unnamed protein product [Chrysoparadoxa australica]
MTEKKILFRNGVINKKELRKIMSSTFENLGVVKAAFLADNLKQLGFDYATQAGISISIEDLRVPSIKNNLISSATKNVYNTEFEASRGEITEVERFQKVINTWNSASESLKDEVVNFFSQTDPLNSVYIMAFSGARGNLSQVRQLVGMRGLMSDPNGQIIDLPIKSNFREGLTVTDYIISSYGARKGLVDTALKTADSGYLTRRLIDVAQDIITREQDCKTSQGINLKTLDEENELNISLEERSIGRLLAFPLIDPQTNKLIADSNEEITPYLASQIDKINFSKVIVRSPLTCNSSRSVCTKCYGWNLAYGNLIDLGEAVGIIAAQSIGEPGTQLTMRTFHTGGVFTTEPSRQVRAKFSGKISFSKFLKYQETRTKYGEKALICLNESTIRLISYKNEILKIVLSPETLILIKDQTYVKKDDILFELPSQTTKTGEEFAFKDVFANFSGEIILENKNKQKYKIDSKNSNIDLEQSNSVLWLLSGDVYNIPPLAKLKVRNFQTLKQNHVLAETKLISIYGGLINLENSSETNSIINITRNIKLFSKGQIYIQKQENKTKKCYLYLDRNYKIKFTLSKSNYILYKQKINFGYLKNLKYQLKTGGLISPGNNQNKGNYFSNIIRNGNTIFYIPEAVYHLKNNKSDLKFKVGDYVKKSNEIVPGKITNIEGFIDINKSLTNNENIEILIKPSVSIQTFENTIIKNYHQKIFFPGEILQEKHIIKRLTFVEVKQTEKGLFFWLRPIVRYEVTEQINELKNIFKKQKLIPEITLKPLNIKIPNNLRLQKNSPSNLVQQNIIFEPKAITKSLIHTIAVETCNKIQIKLITQEQITINNFITDQIKSENLAIPILVKNNQYIEPYSIVAKIQVLVKEAGLIDSIKKQTLGKQVRLFLQNRNNYQSIFFEDKKILNKLNTLVRPGDKIGSNIQIKTAGILKKSIGNSLFINIGQPYLFSAGAIIEKRPGDLVKKQERLGQLVYERARTGDIVQGLPRVEEILEARIPKIEAIITSRPGLITNISNDKIKIWVTPSSRKTSSLDLYNISYSQRLLVGKFDFVKVGQPLNDASINPHTILDAFYYYYQSLQIFTNYESAYRSLRKVQALLVSSVQSVYYSQGVNIADKHIEIIVKQMTGKVEIIKSGVTPLLAGELIDLQQFKYITECVTSADTTLFKPVLLGITKASLKTDSFISAASFQETTRILTEGAIQGKVDWLRGLKENVIVGRLIPTGTGFNSYTDISYITTKIQTGYTNLQSNNLVKKPLSKKYNQLKKQIKFELNS